ncbi:MAG: acyloxyacyl hydrolase [Alphaproteobacteria bacterium]|nr:acyloxyacyl hydrolase [Alphaproteobacteria bacterium]
MKQTFLIFCIWLYAASGLAAEWNPFMGFYQNQIALNIGQGVNSGFIIPPPSQIVPFYLIHMQYSIPATFFGLPARQSINVAQTIGMGARYGWQWDKFTIPMGFLSEDIALVEYEKFYFAGGAGAGLQAQQNKRLGAKLLFMFKLTAGWHLDEHWGLEVFMHHFSNANTAPENYSYAFYGIGTTYQF